MVREFADRVLGNLGPVADEENPQDGGDHDGQEWPVQVA